MLLSVALILLFGLVTGWVCKLIKLPSLIGMLATGIILGPYALNLIDSDILNISADIRKIALIIILTRAGLGLDISGLKKIGRPALMMCFVPASVELIITAVLSHFILGFTFVEGALLGAVLAAVSPAVVVPRMVKLMDEGYGKEHHIPELILAGAAVDDIYVIVLFTTFLGMIQGEGVSAMAFINIPVSIVLGILVGIVAGLIFNLLFKHIHIRDTAKVIIIICASLLLVVCEDMITTSITFSSLIAIMFVGITLKKSYPELAVRLSDKYSKLWVGAEVFLFVLVGACVNINYIPNLGLKALGLIIVALLFRMAGVFISVIGTGITAKEKLFTMLAYTPKATVQAAIGGIPLAAGLACGDTILTLAVIAIVFTAPVGAFLIDSTYRKLLKK